MMRGPRPVRFDSAIELTWLGHATALVELDGVRALTDPVLRDRLGPLVRVAPPPRDEDVAGIGVVLLSHLHCDHADLPSLKRLRAATPLVPPPRARPRPRAPGPPPGAGPPP